MRLRGFVLRALALVLTVGAPMAARADGAKLWFMGYGGRDGSLTAPGADRRVVYLRWDTLEGELPADLTRIELLRDGNRLAAWTRDGATGVVQALDDADDPIPVEQSVGQVYRNPASARRLAEIRAAIEGQAAEKARFTPGDAGAVDHVTEIARKLSQPNAGPNRAWLVLASRLDFNVAILRGRGFVDRDPLVNGVSTHTYALRGYDTVGRIADLGSATVDANFLPRVPQARAFESVSDRFSRCDAPDTGRGHGTVALTWAHPGVFWPERIFYDLNVAGYDLFRTTGHCAAPDPTLDLRSLALGAATDARGRLEIAGLKRANDLPIAIVEPPADGKDPLRKGWKPPFAQFVETAEQLANDGVQPGDQRCYYLAARDLSGNYGETIGLSVRVPDLVPPVSPWEIRAVADSTRELKLGAEQDADALYVEWTHVDAANYMRAYAEGRTFCNPEQAMDTGRLVYAGTAAGCAGAEKTAVNVEVTGYKVYRFEREDDAASFADADGDGISDRDEGATTDDPGLSCDPAAAPAGKTNHLRAAWTVAAHPPERLDDGRLVMRFVDEDPADAKSPAKNKSDVYWYRIASVDADGKIGPLGPPVRAWFPDEVKPPPIDEDLIQVGTCGPWVSQIDPYIDDIIAIDTIGTAETLRLRHAVDFPRGKDPLRAIGAFDEILEFHASALIATVPFTTREADGITERVVVLSGGLYDALYEAFLFGEWQGAPKVRADFLDANGRVLGSIDATVDVMDPARFTVIMQEGLLRFRPVGEVQLDVPLPPVKEVCVGEVRPVPPGGAVEGPVVWLLPAVPGCIELSRRVNGRDYRVKRICGETQAVMPPADLGTDLQCFSVAVVAPNNRTSVPTVKCHKEIGAEKPQPPLLNALTVPVAAGTARLSWFAPDQPVGGIIVETWRKDGDDPDRRSTFVDARGRFGAAPANVHDDELLSLAALPAGAEETWCVRARSISAATLKDLGGKLSDWTEPLCASRVPPEVPPPTYLPWPDIPGVKSQGTLTAVYHSALGRPSVLLGSMPLGDAFPPGSACGRPPPPVECRNADLGQVCDRAPPVVSRCTNYCGLVAKALGTRGRFVAFRQGRDADGTLGDFIEVSPFLSSPTCSLALPHEPGTPVTFTVQDPWFRVLPSTDGGGDEVLQLYFADRTPLVRGRSYRYQLVQFDDRGEITGYHETNWMGVP